MHVEYLFIMLLGCSSVRYFMFFKGRKLSGQAAGLPGLVIRAVWAISAVLGK